MKSFFRKRSVLQLFLMSAVLVVCAVPALAQTATPNITGTWIWKSLVRKKSQTQFRLVISRDGKLWRGTYSVDEFINGQWQGEDGNQTAFMGQMKGNEVQVEFDPEAVQPGYAEHVIYVAPSDGRKPNIAVLTRSGLRLQWRLVSGKNIGVPVNLLLSRERPGKRTR